MKVITGIDIGKSAVKVVTKDLSFLIPSVVSYGSVSSAFDFLVTSNNDFVVSINDLKEHYMAGSIATTGHVNLIAMDENKVGLPYAVLTCAALSKILTPNGHSEVVLATALPYTVYERDKQILKKTLTDIKRFTVNKNHFSVSIHPVVVHEPGAVFMSLVLDSSGTLKNKELLKQKVAVVDVGHRTVNLLLLFQGKELPSSHSTLTGAYSFLQKSLSELAKKVGILSLDDQQLVVEKISKNENFVVNGNFVPIDYFEPVKYEFLKAIEVAVSSVIRDFRCDRLIFAGGGSEWLKSLISSCFPNATVVDNPRFAVANGLFKYAVFVNNRTETRFTKQV